MDCVCLEVCTPCCSDCRRPQGWQHVPHCSSASLSAYAIGPQRILHFLSGSVCKPVHVAHISGICTTRSGHDAPGIVAGQICRCTAWPPTHHTLPVRLNIQPLYTIRSTAAVGTRAGHHTGHIRQVSPARPASASTIIPGMSCHVHTQAACACAHSRHTWPPAADAGDCLWPPPHQPTRSLTALLALLSYFVGHPSGDGSLFTSSHTLPVLHPPCCIQQQPLGYYVMQWHASSCMQDLSSMAATILLISTASLVVYTSAAAAHEAGELLL